MRSGFLRGKVRSETLLKSDSLKQATLPSPLQPGDRLMVIAPSGALREMESFKQGVEIWRSWGFEVDLHPAFSERWGYLAGTDQGRRQQLAAVLQDDRYRGVLCARGGYGGTRLLEGWQWPEQISPKWLIGFSDITSLLWSLAKQGIAGVHGPLLTTLGNEPNWSQQRLQDLVTGKALPPILGETWVRGQATGVLLPANLTVATCLLGTPHEPALDGVILAFEDVTEAPYRIDRMLTHWRMMGKLDQVKAIVLGRFSRCEPPEGGGSFSIEEVLRDRTTDLNIPIVANLPFGHDGDNAALPVGVMAHLNGDDGSLSILTI
jgi:muramoyltetrapeptide carboxypeptidase